MDFHTKYITPNLKLSCHTDRLFKSDVLFEDHILVWLISGETKIVLTNEINWFKTGDIFLIPRNQLATVISHPVNGLPHKSVAMHLSKERLRHIYTELKTRPQKPAICKIRLFNHHPLLESCLASLVPYFDVQEKFPEDIADLKIREAIAILRNIDPEIDGLLTDFSEPGKINLTEFMEKNFMFNLPLEKFGYLTGRSVATFNRDFRKIFKATPQKWLTQKRLELAYYQLKEKVNKPVDVYLETGFENLSHFSYAFKKHFGYSPTDIKKNRKILALSSFWC